MESIPRNPILEFNENTLENVRALYGLNKRERLIQALDILEEWVKKQEHFNKKDFPRHFLERRLVLCKGSIEKTKTKIDKYCALRTLMPEFFKPINLKTNYEYPDSILHALLPKQTEGNDRIYVSKVSGNKFDHSFMNVFRFIINLVEYIAIHDYLNSTYIVLNYLDASTLELSKRADVNEIRQLFTLMIESYGSRVKGIHILTSSKIIEQLVLICKTFVKPKIRDLVQIHTNYESLYKHMPKDCFPQDMGGKEKPIKELHDQWVEVLSGKEFQDHLQEMTKATTNENYRPQDTYYDNYLGIQGSFRTLTLD